MKRRVLSVLLAGLLLLQGNVWAAAEESTPEKNEWITENEGAPVQTVNSVAFVEGKDDGPEAEDFAPDEVPVSGISSAEFSEGGIAETDVVLDEENFQTEKNPETEQFEEGSFGLEEGNPVLTIDSVEEVDLPADMDVYAADIAGETKEEPAVTIDEQCFPDVKFRTYVEDFDIDGDQELSAAEIGAVSDIDVRGKRIGSLAGIEYFTSLRTLNCSVNQLKTLDVSKNTVLTELNCSINQLTDLDVSRNPALSVLDSSSNKTGGLDVSRNPELTVLKCGNNGLTSLDISRNPKLSTLDCTNNQLTGLDISSNVELTELNCGDNQLTVLNVTQNPKLTALECYGNQLENLDLSRNTSLVTLFCYSNNLTELNVSPCAGIMTLSCGSNKLTKLAVGTGAALTDLNCEDNQLTSLDVSGFSKLRLVDCSRNQLTSLIIGNHISLNTIECEENQLTSLDVSGDIALQNLICNSNRLTELDLTHKGDRCHNDNLSWLDCSDNRLKALNLSGNPVVKQVICENNQIRTLDVSAHANLEILNCTGNQIESLNVTGCRSMTGLDCENNRLTSLDVGTNTALKYLFCGANPLMSLDLSKNRSLDELKCEQLVTEVPSCSYNSSSGFDLAGLIGKENLDRVTVITGKDMLEGGIIKFSSSGPEQFSYEYDTKFPLSLAGVSKKITVMLKLTAHQYRTIVDKEATCTQPGSQHWKCAACGDEKAAEEIPAAGHVFGAVIEEAATCTQPGSQYRACAVCGAREVLTEQPAAGHVYGEPIVDREPTCAAPGSRHRICTVCGDAEAAEEIPATGIHSYGEYTVTEEPTVEKEGLETRICSVCGGTESRAVEKLEPKITLSADSILLQKKQSTDRLAVSELAKGDRVVSWKSGNKKLVTVKSTGNLEKCTLTAKNKTGSTKITVTLASGLKKKIKVTVQEGEVATTKISGLEKNMTLFKGEKITLAPVITPVTSTQKVTYQTSNKKIVTVNAKGVVKAVKKGKAKITVKSGNKTFVIIMNIKKSKN